MTADTDVATKPLPRRVLLDELRAQYEAAAAASHQDMPVEDFESIDARLRKSFRWLEQAVTYLNTLKPAIDHTYDLGHGFVFAGPRFSHGSVALRERRLRGFPVVEEIGVYYDIAAARPLTIEVPAGWLSFAQRTLDAFGLQYTSRSLGAADGERVFSVAPVIPARISFTADYQAGVVTATLVNVDRLDRVSLAFQSGAIVEPALEDLVRLMLGRDSAFLHRAPVAWKRDAVACAGASAA